MEYHIYNGDCLELMQGIPDKSIDMILCDLPYGMLSCKWDSTIPFHDFITVDGKIYYKNEFLNLCDKSNVEESIKYWNENSKTGMWEQYNRIIKDDGVIALFSSGIFTINLISSNIQNYKYKLIWEKNVPTGMASAKYRPMKYYEEICIFSKGKNTYNPIMKERVGKGKSCYNYEHYCGNSNHIQVEKKKIKYDPDFVQPSDVLHFDVVPNRKGKLHPTQKPVDLLEYLIKTYTNYRGVVLDSCMGSGSTGVAAVNTSRNFIGIEIDEDYFNIAQERIDKQVDEVMSKR